MDVASVVGWAGLALLAYFIVHDLLTTYFYYVFAKKHRLTKDLRRYGSWAVVTGATDGIGKAYAVQLAKRGLNIYLLGRNAGKLHAVSTEVERAGSNVLVRSILVDFVKIDTELRESIRRELDSVDVGILVNNVGMCYTYPKYFHEVEDHVFIQNIIRVNCEGITQITNMVLPQMIRKNNGAIINVSSILCKFPGAYLALYGATKAFVSYFTRSLQEEYSNTGIVIQGVLPFYVVSNMCRARPNFFVPRASDYASCALDTVGLQDWTYGCLAHGTLGALISYVRKEIFVHFVTPYMAKVRQKQVMKRINSNNWISREKPKYG